MKSRWVAPERLTAAGFTVADVRQAPDRPGLEYVVTAVR